jgi:3-oxoacyl-[acyl-carrier-protein] synthase II
VTTAAAAPDPVVVSAWSTVSPYGVGRTVFAGGIRAGRSGITELDRQAYPGPYERAALVPDFVPAQRLGPKGTRSMDRVTAIAVELVRELLAETGPAVAEDSENVGLVLGTGSGSVQSIMDFTRTSLTGQKPYRVDPALFPNTVMNRAAGQSAIWHRIKGPNATVAGGTATALLALSYATRLLRGGHCRRVLSGAVEEYSQQRAWLEWQGREQADAPPLAEGGALLLLEPATEARRAGRQPVATVLATRFMAAADPTNVRTVLADCIRAVLKTGGVAAEDVCLTAPCGGDSAAAEEQAVADVLGRPAVVDVRALLGDASAVSGGFQMAAVLARAEAEPLPGAALITTVDAGGTVGCALLRTEDGRHG